MTDSSKLNQIANLVCKCQILFSAIILSIAIIIYGIIAYNTNRYIRDKGGVFDRNTGKIYQSCYSRKDVMPPYYFILDHKNQTSSIAIDKKSVYYNEEQRIKNMTHGELLDAQNYEEERRKSLRLMSDEELMLRIKNREKAEIFRESELEKAQKRAKDKIKNN